VVVTVFSDDNKKYLSTDLMGDEPADEGFFSIGVELESCVSYKRVCTTCCRPDECSAELKASLLESLPFPGCTGVLTGA